MRASLVALALIWAGCTFPTEGVPAQGDPPDAEIVPPDACIAVAEVCDGADNDCDGTIDDGVSSGAACDGDDADLCTDDTMICDETGAEVCSSGEDNVELCNEADDDCDVAIDEGYVLDENCDGADGDECDEGVTICAGDQMSTTCSDATDTIVEACNQLDDDCDMVADDGFDLQTDEANCGTCNTVCQQVNSTNTCTPPGTCVPACNNGAAQCDGSVNNGCELVNTNPVCPTSTTLALDIDGNAADVNGDTNGETIMLTGTTERFMRIRLRESSQSGTQDAIQATLTLASGAGTDWDLFVYCKANCAEAPLSATNDVITVGRTDIVGNDRTFDIIAEVRYDAATPSTTCAQWTLTVVGDPTGDPSVTPASTCGD